MLIAHCCCTYKKLLIQNLLEELQYKSLSMLVNVYAKIWSYTTNTGKIFFNSFFLQNVGFEGLYNVLSTIPVLNKVRRKRLTHQNL